MEDVAYTLKNIEDTVLTWPLAAHGNDESDLRDSIMESLKSILTHLGTDDNESASDSSGNSDKSDSNHGDVSEDNSTLENDYNDNVSALRYCI
jgi:hypothetical protein